MPNFSIPSSIKTDYVQFMTELFSNDITSNNVTLYYPAVRTSCPSCEVSSPSSFHPGECVMCGGDKFIETETTAVIRLRIHINANQLWSKLNRSIEIPEGSLVCIGKMTDVQSVLACSYAIMYADVIADHNWKYKLASDPLPHGFGRDTYFISLWEKF